MDCLTSWMLSQKASSYKCQFCTKECASSRLISQVYVMAGQNIKKKTLMGQISIKMFKQYAIPNSGLQNLKIYSSKEGRKASQKWNMYVANTAILKPRIFSERYHFRLWVFASIGEYIYCWHPRGYNVNDSKTFKNLVVSFHALYQKLYVYCKFAHLNWPLKINLN